MILMGIKSVHSRGGHEKYNMSDLNARGAFFMLLFRTELETSGDHCPTVILQSHLSLCSAGRSIAVAASMIGLSLGCFGLRTSPIGNGALRLYARSIIV